MAEKFRSEPLDQEPKTEEPKSEELEHLITDEHLIMESGRINSERILELEQKFRDAVKVIEKGQYDIEDSTEYYEAVAEMDNAFNEAATVLLNTLDHTQGHVITGLVFHNLKRLLRKAAENSSDIYSLYDVYNRIIGNFPRIEARLNEGGMEPLESVVLISESEEEEQKMEATGFLVKQLPAIERYLRVDTPIASARDVGKIYPALKVLLEHSSEQTKQNALRMIQQLVVDIETCPEGAEILGSMLDYKQSSKQTADEAIKIIHYCLQYYKVDKSTAEEWVKEWTSSHETKGLFARKNLEAVVRLENDKAGITKSLSEKYGITAFGRYPTEMLLEQIANAKNQERPYGIVLYPKDDWNGAFHQDEMVFWQLSISLGIDRNMSRYLIRIYECGSKKDIAKILIDLDKTYGERHKISFAIIGGHGTKDSINFGGGASKRNLLYSSDLHRSRVQKTGDFFEPEATVVLVSCSTGQNEGIGQTLTEKLGMKVIAPTVPTNVRKIIPKFVAGKLDFDVEYTDKDTTAIYARSKIPKVGEGIKAE